MVSKDIAFAGFEAEGEAAVRHRRALGKYNDEYSLLAAEWCWIKDQESKKADRRFNSRQRWIDRLTGAIVAWAAVAIAAYLGH